MRARRAIAAIVAATLAVAAAAYDRFEDLPGAEGVRQLQAALRDVGRDARVSDIRWDADGIVFRRGGAWVKVDRDGANERPAEEPSERAAVSRPVDPPAGRARQRTQATSPDGLLRAEHRDGGVRIVEIASGMATPVIAADPKEPGIVFGTADWVYGEELDQDDAMWWSPDG